MAMRSCDPFDIPLPSDLAGTLERVKTGLVKDGGKFTGDEEAGKFAGTSALGDIEGTYVVKANVIRITISSKPMLAPCGMIESKIRQYFA